MLIPAQVFEVLDMLDHFDTVKIEENQNGEDVDIAAIFSYNTGNNCLHFPIIHNNHRIVIQTYKYLNSGSKPVDIVQGKPELEDSFIDFIEYLNDSRLDFSDQTLNNIFILYCGIWQKCSAFYKGEMDCYVFEFGPDMRVCYDAPKNEWIVTIEGVPMQFTSILYNFITAIENICK